MKARLALLRPGDSAHVRDRLTDHLQRLVGARPGLWGTYHPLPGEAAPLTEAPPGVEWVFPRMQEGSLVYCRGRDFVKGRFGVTEPSPSSPTVAADELSGVLVPGLAFDREGRRLGRGQGFYDRTLSGFTGLSVGVAYAIQLIAEVPADALDVPVRAVVTEESVFWRGGTLWKS